MTLMVPIILLQKMVITCCKHRRRRHKANELRYVSRSENWIDYKYHVCNPSRPWNFLSLHLHHFSDYLRQQYLPSTMSGPKTSSNIDATERLSPAPQPDYAPSSTTSRPATRAFPPAPSQWPVPGPALFPTTPVESPSVEDLLALSLEVFASRERVKATTSLQSKLTPAQKGRIEINRKEAIRRRRERLKENINASHCKGKFPRTGSNCSPSEQVRIFYMY